MNFDYGNILTRALQLTWRHKSLWLFMMFPMLIASVFLLSFVAPVFLLEGSEDMLGLALAVWIGVAALGVFAALLASAAGFTALTLGILRVERGEGSTAFMDLLRDSFQYFGRALGVIVIVQSTIGLVFTVFFLCVAGLIAVTAGVAAICLQPAIILVTPLTYLVAALMSGAILSVIDEGLGAWEAVKRAWQVIRDHVWKFLLLTLAAYIGASILSSAAIVPAMLPAMFAPAAVEMGEQAFWAVMLLFVCTFFPLMSVCSGVIGTFTTAVVDIAYLRLSHPAEEAVVFVPDKLDNAAS